MANYDATVRIGTSIDKKNTNIQLMALENQITKKADKIASIMAKMTEMKAAKVPTQEYKDLQKELSGAQKEMERMGMQTGKLTNLNSKIQKLTQSASELAEKMKEAEVRVPTEEYGRLENSIEQYKFELESLTEEQKRLSKSGLGQDIDKEYLKAAAAVQRLKGELQQAVSAGDQNSYLAIEDKLDRAKAVLQEMMAKNPKPLGDIQYYYSVEQKVSDIKKRITDTENKMQKLFSTGEAYAVDTNTPKYQELASKYEAVNQKLAETKGLHDQITQKQEESSRKVDDIKGKMTELVDTGKAFTLGSDAEEYANMAQQLSYLQNELSVLNEKNELLIAKQSRAAENYKRFRENGKAAFTAIGNLLQKASARLDSFGQRLKEVAQKHMPSFRRETERTKTALSGFRSRLKSLLSGIFIFNVISSGFRQMFSAVSDGYKNLYNDNERFKSSVDHLKASLTTLKNTLAAAFRPIVEIAIPYIQRLVEWITTAVNMIGQFIAALTGRKTYTRAIKQSAEASKDAADAAEDETEAMNRQLSPLDKLNNLSSQNNKNKAGSSASEDGGTGVMFEEVPIDSNILDMVEHVKDILGKLFAPLKEAWNREGQFVMDSWKYALDEVWKLIKDIGRDFLTVWQQEATIKIFEDLLHIIGDIGLVVGNLARNFRDAWNENSVGLHILEKIRDIIGIIVQHIRNAADATVEWSDKLDFYPLLDAFNRFLDSLKPVVDSLSGTLEDFYTKVLLPLGKWMLEKGLPELLQVFTDFNDKVDWESLRANLAEFWEHLEPFAETVGEGLIIFIDRVSDALADFINSQEFKDFLVMIENWMDSVSPEDVADALEKIAGAIVLIKVAATGFQMVSAVTKIIPVLSAVINGLKAALSMLASPAGIVVALVAALAAGFIYAYNTSDEFRQKLSDLKDKFIEFWEQNLKPVIEEWGEKFRTLWEEHLKPCMDSIMNLLGKLWEEVLIPLIAWVTDNVLPVLLPIADSMMTKVTDVVGAISDAVGTLSDIISGLIELVVDLIHGDWSGAWDSAKGIVQSAAGWIKGCIEGIIGKITKLGEKLSSLFGGQGVTMTGSPAGAVMPRASRMSSSAAYTMNAAVAALNNMEVPAYATGQVIPRTMKEHLAKIGDNTKETEVVSPLSTIRQALREEAVALGLGGSNNGQEISLNLTVECEGYQLLKVLQKLDSEYFKQHGRHALA
ncbi:MAG: hypothetical protein NC489_19640 [Ruminococcus flavefaciens]|nr:hypothetical protein [Ruminococcus flavefaciens]